MSVVLPFTPIALILVLGWVGLRVRDDRFGALQRFPESRYLPYAVALVMMGVIWYLWGSLHQLSVTHDEASYVLQAQTFARGRWAMPSPPIPAFFEQFHVFVTPTYASKYPPGHGILLVPGVWLGLPGLMPVLLSGLTAALLFVLVRRVTNGWVALLTFVLWLPMTANLGFRPSYFSENTSSALWLLGWWALLKWREREQRGWLVVLAACAGWLAITRPLTAVAFAIPVGGAVIWRVAHRRSWRALVVPMLVGTAIVSLIPIWSLRTTGNWRQTPYTLYAKTYFPFDVAGFGLDTTPAAHPLPADMKRLIEAFGPVHTAHTVDRLPRILYDRWHAMFVEAFYGVRYPLAIFALVALVVLPAAGWFAVCGSIVLTLCYLVYAHPAEWDLYYLEIIPLFPFLAACGLWVSWLWLGKKLRAGRQAALQTMAPHAALAGAIVAVILSIPARSDVLQVHGAQLIRRQVQASFASAVADLPGARKIIFIRYKPAHYIHRSFIANQADLADARTWFVYDRGSENASLTALAPGRVPYLFDEASSMFYHLPSNTAASDSTVAVARPKH